MDNDIIRIAGAMGWERRTRILDANESPQVACTGEPVQITEWLHPNGIDSPYSRLPFSPLTSHADCHALIEWLRAEKGLQVAVLYYEGENIVQLIEPGSGKAATDAYEGPDYRLGVVELTLKLLEKEGG